MEQLLESPDKKVKTPLKTPFLIDFSKGIPGLLKRTVFYWIWSRTKGKNGLL